MEAVMWKIIKLAWRLYWEEQRRLIKARILDSEDARSFYRAWAQQHNPRREG
jgi:hypothetical protein